MGGWRFTLFILGIQLSTYSFGQQADLFSLCPSLMSGIQTCADKYMPGKQTPMMAMFDPKAIGKIDLNIDSYKQMCSTMINKMDSHFTCINKVLNMTTCPALGLDLSDLLNPNLLDGMKRSWKYTCDNLEVLNSDTAQTCLLDTNKKLIRCITKKSREKKMTEAIDEVTETKSNQQDVVKLTNCIMYSLSSLCFKEALQETGCPKEIQEVSWKSVKLVIPQACNSGPYSAYKELFVASDASTSKTIRTVVLPYTLLTYMFLFYWH